MGGYPSAFYAMENFFGYSSDISYEWKDNHSTNEYRDIIKNELDNNRPTIAQGYGSGYGGGYGGAKQQKIRVWYEGKADSILKRVGFGDITLNLPNTRFLNINRNLFGLEAIVEIAGAKITSFASRSKGISDTRRFRGESRRAG